MTPTAPYVKAVNVAAQAFLRTVSKVVGGDVIDDAIAFFQAFDGMEAGFRDRAERVLELLAARRDVVRARGVTPRRHRRGGRRTSRTGWQKAASRSQPSS